MADDLEKAKILLGWACRVYGPAEDADQAEFDQFANIGCRIAGIEPEILARVSEEDVVATMLAEVRQEAAQLSTPQKRGRGRPATPHKHLWIVHTIEAYIGAGLRRKAAIYRAATHWGLSPSTVKEIYKDNKLAKPISKQIRAFLVETPEDVDETIRQYQGYDPQLH